MNVLTGVPRPASVLTAVTRPTSGSRRHTYVGPCVVLVILIILYVVRTPDALSSISILTLVNDSAVVALAAMGEAIVLVVGGFDLSVGAVLSLINVVLATHFAIAGQGTVAPVLVGLVIGLFAGLINGLLVSVGRIASVVVTIGTSFVFSGVALLVQPTAGGIVSQSFINQLTGSIGGVIPDAAVIMAVIAVGWTWVRRTRFGAVVYAVGNDSDAAVTAGLRVAAVRVGAYGLAGLCYGAAAIFLTAQTGSGDPNVGGPLTLSVFAAAVVGGVRLGGGQGYVPAAIAGAFILSLIGDVLFSFGVSSFYTNVYTGAVLIAAVLISSTRFLPALRAVRNAINRWRKVAV